MNEKKHNKKIINPHDKLVRETLSVLENALSVLQNFMPEKVLGLMDLSTLEICKDSFVEKELADYYSDMLYRVNLSGTPGYVYVLFEHKSYYDRYVHLQLLEYMVKVWRLFIK
jgi:predicted transposase/invertase (TIGR01784 family)